MVVLNITLEEESNPEFYKLINEQKSLMDRFNDLNKQAHSFKIPRLWLFKIKRKLRLIAEGIGGLQKDFISWYGRTRDFCYTPVYKIGGTSEEKLIIYLQYTATLRDVMNKFNTDMLMLAQNYNDREVEYVNQFNFLIAMTGLVIAVIGIVIAL